VEYEAFLARVGELGGLPDRSGALRATTATLGVLSERLVDEEIGVLTIDLPSQIGALLSRRAPCGGDFGVNTFFERVARREGTSVGQALEHAQIVCEVLAANLSAEHRHRLIAHLPDEWRELFSPPSRAGVRERFVHQEHHPHNTLAEGRPGSSNPLSEARPERAHSESVVRAENPHGDRKLSSSRKTEDGLSDAHPGPERPISET